MTRSYPGHVRYIPAHRTFGFPVTLDLAFGTPPILQRPAQGRQALIIAENTTALTATPEFKAEDDHLTEVREVEMAPYGPA